MVAPYTFPGFIPFLEQAAQDLGHPEAAHPARRISALTSLANLCSQVPGTADAQASAILAKAEEFRDQILVAYLASERMLQAVRMSQGMAGRPNSATHDLERHLGNLARKRRRQSPQTEQDKRTDAEPTD